MSLLQRRPDSWVAGELACRPGSVTPGLHPRLVPRPVPHRPAGPARWCWHVDEGGSGDRCRRRGSAPPWGWSGTGRRPAARRWVRRRSPGAPLALGNAASGPHAQPAKPPDCAPRPRYPGRARRCGRAPHLFASWVILVVSRLVPADRHPAPRGAARPSAGQGAIQNRAMFRGEVSGRGQRQSRTFRARPMRHKRGGCCWSISVTLARISAGGASATPMSMTARLTATCA